MLNDTEIREKFNEIKNIGPTEIISTSIGDVTVKIPLWEDYLEIMTNIPEEFLGDENDENPDPELQKERLKFIQKEIIKNWIVKPKVTEEHFIDPIWAVPLLKIGLTKMIPFYELFDIKKKLPKSLK